MCQQLDLNTGNGPAIEPARDLYNPVLARAAELRITLGVRDTYVFDHLYALLAEAYRVLERLSTTQLVIPEPDRLRHATMLNGIRRACNIPLVT